MIDDYIKMRHANQMQMTFLDRPYDSSHLHLDAGISGFHVTEESGSTLYEFPVLVTVALEKCVAQSSSPGGVCAQHGGESGVEERQNRR